MDDGEAIHTALFLAARDGEKIPANVDVFNTELTPEQIQKLDELKKWVDGNIHKAQYTDEKNQGERENDFKCCLIQALSRGIMESFGRRLEES